ncbi:S66 peptidase family protein [Eilatimonas milleporae]|uniref:Muramoyltetrapeptide carboxypeptidase n=1 Tax=Eilatimonas milleporae TaxID=911205 RepID=A0A3M0CVS1_9PROT|nr:LD-carboxypeptidase [Eilatimonas milleporae]RMB07743.1 muramoyltetrapeptide carboxypeptidase [Eilatimonas milleporae]
MDRRQFLSLIGATSAATLLPTAVWAQQGQGVQQGQDRPALLPQSLKPGDRVRLIAPAGVIYEDVRIEIARENMAGLGLDVSVGDHVLDRHGYFAGTDAARAADIMAAFTDPAVKAVVALSGGWGAARTLPHLDFDIIRQNPKILMGFSDVTALLNAVTGKTGLVTFHGPNATSEWTSFSVNAARRLLFAGGSGPFAHPPHTGGTLARHRGRLQTIAGGTAEGWLAGGNLTVLTALVGTPYMPDMAGAILFLEDIGEAIYRVDRMLTTLGQAGVLDRVAGIVFGGFTDVGPDGDGFGAFALSDILRDHVRRAGKPAYLGLMAGHRTDQLTLPIGARARLDADARTLSLTAAAVKR